MKSKNIVSVSLALFIFVVGTIMMLAYLDSLFYFSLSFLLMVIFLVATFGFSLWKGSGWVFRILMVLVVLLAIIGVVLFSNGFYSEAGIGILGLV